MKVLVVGMVNSTNLGDVAIYLCIRKLLEENGVKVYSSDFNGLSHEARNPSSQSEFSGEKRDGFVGWVRRILLETRALATIVNNLRWARKKRSVKKRYQDSVKSVDVLLFGGGQIITDIFYGLPLRYELWLNAIEKNNKKHFIEFCGVGNSFSHKGRDLYNDFVGAAQAVSVRGQRSRVQLENILDSERDIGLVPDPVFMCSELYPVLRASKPGVVGICYQDFSSLALHHDAFRKLGVKGFHRSLTVLIDEVIKHGKTICIFTNGSKEDFIGAQSFYEDHYLQDRRVQIAKRPLSLPTLIEIITACEKVISFRMHASIISYSYGVPTRNIVWDEKVIDVWECFGDQAVPWNMENIMNNTHDLTFFLESCEISQGALAEASLAIRARINLLIQRMATVLG